MRFLVDTHNLLWTLESPGKLSEAVRRIIEDPASELLLSLATPWELAIKTNSGKLDAAKILRDFEQLTNIGGYEVLETRFLT